jgi:hypothetical protein
MMNPRRSCIGLLAGWFCTALWAQAPEVELEQVKAQRSRLEAHHDEQIRQCHQKLNVNDCKREAQIDRSEALRPVVNRQRELEAVLRKQKADEQRAKALERREAHERRMQDRGGPPVALPLEPPVPPRQP